MDARVVVGRVIKPHGIRGEVGVHPLTDFPDQRFAAGNRLWVDGRPTEVESGRPHQGKWLVKLAAVPDRNAAELLRGAELTAEPLDTDELDTYLQSELVGMRVETTDGAPLGDVRAVIELPEAAAYDLLEVVRPDGATWLLPAVDEYVAVDADPDGTEFLVVVDPPAGLLPDDADGDDADAPAPAPTPEP